MRYWRVFAVSLLHRRAGKYRALNMLRSDYRQFEGVLGLVG